MKKSQPSVAMRISLREKFAVPPLQTSPLPRTFKKGYRSSLGTVSLFEVRGRVGGFFMQREALLLFFLRVIKSLSLFMGAQVADRKHGKIYRYGDQGNYGIGQKFYTSKGRMD